MHLAKYYISLPGEFPAFGDLERAKELIARSESAIKMCDTLKKLTLEETKNWKTYLAWSGYELSKIGTMDREKIIKENKDTLKDIPQNEHDDWIYSKMVEWPKMEEVKCSVKDFDGFMKYFKLLVGDKIKEINFPVYEFLNMVAQKGGCAMNNPWRCFRAKEIPKELFIYDENGKIRYLMHIPPSDKTAMFSTWGRIDLYEIQYEKDIPHIAHGMKVLPISSEFKNLVEKYLFPLYKKK
jgi:hypothetical protein